MNQIYDEKMIGVLATRREKARLLVQEFRSKWGMNRPERRYRRVTPVVKANTNHKGGSK